MGVAIDGNILLGLAKTRHLSAKLKREERCRCKSKRPADSIYEICRRSQYGSAQRDIDSQSQTFTANCHYPMELNR